MKTRSAPRSQALLGNALPRSSASRHAGAERTNIRQAEPVGSAFPGRAWERDGDNMPLVEIRNLSKVYHKGEQAIRPLHNVDLDIERGDFLSLRGASGS